MQDSITKRMEAFRDLWGLVFIIGGLTLFIILGLWMIMSEYNLALGTLFQPASAELDNEAQTAFTAATGIKVIRVTLMAGGGMVDLRYRVIDPDKAIIVHDDAQPPGFIDHGSGRLINIPHHNHGASELRPGVTYSEIIMNSDGVLKRGSKVAVLVGDYRLEEVTVQ